MTHIKQEGAEQFVDFFLRNVKKLIFPISEDKRQHHILLYSVQCTTVYNTVQFVSIRALNRQ